MILIFLLGSAYGQDKYLLVSVGGGFTGSAVVYKIYEGGVVLKGKGVGDISYDESGKLRKGATKKFFTKTRSLLSDNPEFDHPGNIYTSLILFENGTEKKMTWGDAKTSAPENATKLYEKINGCLKKLTFTPELRK
ncbi:MAG: hypothetical protein ABIS36_21700 [Chryseolinea sp.]